jgi:hypothetical protein
MTPPANSSAILLTLDPPALPAKRLPRSLLAVSHEEAAVTISCEAGSGRYEVRCEVASQASLAVALERFYTRLSVELEGLWERHVALAEGSVGIAALLTRPERFTQHLRVVRGGVQSSAPLAPRAPEQVKLRIEAAALSSEAEHAVDAAFVAPLWAALLGSGARVSVEACIVGALAAMLQAELEQGDARLA